MAKIIAVVNQKGGVGKTTTSVNLAASLAHLGQKILLVDLDPQGNAGSALGIFPKPDEATVYQALIGTMELAKTIRGTELPYLDIIPANTQLSGAEVELVSAFARETRLKRALEPLRLKYDVILLDCPPSIGLLTVNALTAADGVILPLQCEYYALEGLSHMLETIRLVRGSLNEQLEIFGVLLTMYDARNKLSHQVVAEARKHMSDTVYKTMIPRNVRLSEAPSHGKPAIIYDEYSRGAVAYLQFAKEVVRKHLVSAKSKPKAKAKGNFSTVAATA